MPVKSYSGNHAKFPLGSGLWLALIRVTPSTIPGRLWNDPTLGLCRSKSKWRGSLKGKVWSCSVASLTSIFLIWRSIFPFLPYFSNPYLQFFHHCHWSLESIGVVDLLGWSNPCSSWTPGWRQPDFFFKLISFLCYHSIRNIFTYIYQKNQPTVCKYNIHGWEGLWLKQGHVSAFLIVFKV